MSNSWNATEFCVLDAPEWPTLRPYVTSWYASSCPSDCELGRWIRSLLPLGMVKLALISVQSWSGQWLPFVSTSVLYSYSNRQLHVSCSRASSNNSLIIKGRSHADENHAHTVSPTQAEMHASSNFPSGSIWVQLIGTLVGLRWWVRWYTHGKEPPDP